jgi:hypothetical protein
MNKKGIKNNSTLSDNQKREMILEKRFARIENLIKNEARTSKKFESFESDLDEEGARAAADRLANQFANMVGVSLTPDNMTDTIDSPVYGTLDAHSASAAEEIADDPDARFTFDYSVDGYPADTVKVRPTDGTICVWRSVYDGYYGEGAVDPESGECEWEDWLGDCSYPLSAWKNFSFDMIHGDEDDDYDDDDEYDDDEYDESLKHRATRNDNRIKNENAQSDHDLREIIYNSLADGHINQGWLIDECLTLMNEEQLLDLCYNMHIEI